MEQETLASRCQELNAALDRLLLCAASRAPNSSAFGACKLLNSFWRDSPAPTEAEHRQRLSLIDDCVYQLKSGAQELDLSAARPKPHVAEARRRVGLPQRVG